MEWMQFVYNSNLVRQIYAHWSGLLDRPRASAINSNNTALTFAASESTAPQRCSRQSSTADAAQPAADPRGPAAAECAAQRGAQLAPLRRQHLRTAVALSCKNGHH